MVKSNRRRYGILTADLCWTVGAMFLAYLLRYEPAWRDPAKTPIVDFAPFLVATVIFWGLLSFWFPLDGFRGGWRFASVLSQLFAAVSGLTLLLFAGGYIARWYISRLVIGYFVVFVFIGVVLIRLAARAFFVSRHLSGAVRRSVIVGSGPIADEIARKIRTHPEIQWEIVGFLYPAGSSPPLEGAKVDANPITVRSVGVTDLLESRAIDDIILTIPKPGHAEISDLVARCFRKGIAVTVVPQPYELYVSRPKFIDLDGLPLLRLEHIPVAEGNPLWKRLLDLSLITCLLPITIPPILVAAAWLKARKGKGFRGEMRCGQSGRTFLMYRLNSDRHGVELPFVEFLMQQMSLTELPQILNVFRGEMSLVGPRPEGVERVREYSDWQRQRLGVKPGITGLAQVHGLRDQSSSEDKTRYDLQYILHRSLFVDVSLLFQTLWTLTWRLFQMKRPVIHPSHLSPSTTVSTTFEGGFANANRPQSSTD